MCGCGYAHAMTCVCVGGWVCQRTACRSQLSPSTVLVPGSDSDCQAWQREPLTSESSHQFILIFFCFFFNLSECVNLCVCFCVCKCVCLCRYSHIWWVCCSYLCLCVCVGANTRMCVCILSLLSSCFLIFWDSVSHLRKACILQTLASKSFPPGLLPSLFGAGIVGLSLHFRLCTWVLATQTQALMFVQQSALPTEPFLQSQ